MTRPVDTHLDNLREQILRMAGLAESIVDKAIKALFERSRELADQVRQDDLEIDKLDVSIEQTTLNVLATQAPVADDLREVMAVKMISTELERVGDLARNIAKCAERLGKRPEVQHPAELRTLASAAQRMLRRANEAFSNRDISEARSILDFDDEVDTYEDEVIRSTLKQIRRHPEESAQDVDFILAAKHLERIADHAANITEDLVFAVSGRILKHEAKLNR